MSRRPQTAGTKKKVGFSLQGTKIEAPDTIDMDHSMLAAKNKQRVGKNQKEVYTEKAREFESFKQIPKYAHRTLAVIHPSPTKVKREIGHMAPKTLAFDSTKMNVAHRSFVKKQLPEHLTNPPIDEEKLMKIRAKEKLRLAESTSKGGVKVSLAAKNAEKALVRAKGDLNIKIKRSEKCQKQLFNELKKIIEKHEEEVIFKGSNQRVEIAKKADKDGNFVSFIYDAFNQASGGMPQNSPQRVSMKQFAAFVKFFIKEMTDQQCNDIFMLSINKLQEITKMLAASKSPNQSRVQDESMISLDQSMNPFQTNSPGLRGSPGKLNDNSDLMDTSGIKALNASAMRDMINNYGMGQRELDEVKMDITYTLDNQFQKWAEDDDSLSGVLNVKITKQSNIDLRLKMQAWKNRVGERKVIKKRNFDHGKLLREFFIKSIDNFNLEKERVRDCITKYNGFSEEMVQLAKQNKLVNNFLSDLPANAQHIMQLDDLNKLVKNAQIKEAHKISVMQGFITNVKQECVMSQHYFSFFDIPDLIVKKGYSRKDYEECILKCLNKVKLRYLAEKRKELPHKDIENIQITDEDLIPLELFDWVMSTIENKMHENTKTIQKFIKDCHLAVDKIHAKMKLDSDKTKKLVEQNVFITFLNSQMEQRNTMYFKNGFIHRNLYIKFIRQNQTGYRAAKEFENAFMDVMKADLSASSFHEDYKRKHQAEMNKFNGTFGDGPETASEMTTATKLTKKSGTSFGRSAQSPGGRPEDLDEAANFKGTMEGTINDRDPNFDPNPMGEMDDEDAEEAERMAGEAKKAKDSGETDFQKCFKDQDGKDFNPQKKFGVIEDEYLLYDNVTTSYPLNLPTDYYQKFITENMPKKESGNGKWFIRPHHLETLTNHPSSIKDGVLNTRYYSHYDQEFGVKKEVNPSEEAITNIETHLQQLQSKMQVMMLQRGDDPDNMDNLRETTKHEGLMAYEKFINERKRLNPKDLIIDAYEGVLTHNRETEKDVLNKQRFTEYEKNRPPQDNWYEMKSSGFQKELYRNRVALKPNNSNAVYLENLQDKNLY